MKPMKTLVIAAALTSILGTSVHAEPVHQQQGMLDSFLSWLDNGSNTNFTEGDGDAIEGGLVLGYEAVALSSISSNEACEEVRFVDEPIEGSFNPLSEEAITMQCDLSNSSGNELIEDRLVIDVN